MFGKDSKDCSFALVEALTGSFRRVITFQEFSLPPITCWQAGWLNDNTNQPLEKCAKEAEKDR